MPSGIHSRFIIATLSITLILTASTVQAWGRLGHRLAGHLADRHLTPKARAAIRGLLEPGESMADASTWADEHRRDIKESGPWHYVDVPLSEDRYDNRFAGDVPEKGYIIPKIREFRTILKDPRRPIAERRLALRFLIHLIEDLHQPLHVGENHDRGGNALQIQFFGEGTNLHRLWDRNMLTHAEKNEGRWLRTLLAMDTPKARQKALTGLVEDWATESLLAARKAYVNPRTGKMIRKGARLGQAYQDANLPVARQRLYLSGIRLAAVLNEIFSDTRGR